MKLGHGICIHSSSVHINNNKINVFTIPDMVCTVQHPQKYFKKYTCYDSIPRNMITFPIGTLESCFDARPRQHNQMNL